MKICPNCGTEVERIFCPDCGTKVLESTTVDIGAPTEEPIVVESAEEPGVNEASTAETIEEASFEVRQEVVPVPNTRREYRNSGKTGKFSAKSTGIVAYVGWIGLIIALVLGDKEGAKFHLNQALVIYLASIVFSIAGSLLPILGGLVVFAGGIFTVVCWGLGLYYAVTQQEREVPLLGQIKLL